MSPVYSLQMFAGGPPAYGPDGYETNYCGCWHVRCPDEDRRAAQLRAAGVGRFLDEDGSIGRAFFLADELEAQVAAARATGCHVEVRQVVP